jgi:non-ribosomal peptide synthetase component F
MNTSIESIRQLSPIQQDFLSGYLMDVNRRSYTSQWIGFYRQTIIDDRFNEAWKKVVHKHSILRTAFDWENPSRPVQVVLSSVDAKVLTHVVSNCTSFESFRSEVKEIAKVRYNKGFNIKKPPLMDFEIVNSGLWSAVIWSRHHLITDGWSLSSLYDDIVKIYLECQEESCQNVMASPYSNFIDALRPLLKNDEDRKYWADYLRTHNTNVYETQSLGRHCAELNRSYPIEFLNKIKKLGITCKVTPNSIFVATLLDALSRVFGTEESCLGITEALSGVAIDEEEIIGPKITTLPFFGKSIRENSGSEDLLDIHRRLLLHRSHAYASIKDVVSGIKSLNFTYRGLLNTCYVYQNYPKTIQDSTSNNFSLIDEIDFSEPGAPILVIVEPSSSNLKIRILSKDSEFNQESIKLLITNWEASIFKLIEQASKSQQSNIRSRNRLTGSTKEPIIGTKAIIKQIELTALSAPQRQAIVDRYESVTYADLWERIKNRTRDMQTSLNGMHSTILIKTSDQVNDIINILSIWKSGCAHLAIDSKTPSWSIFKFYKDDSIIGFLSNGILTLKRQYLLGESSAFDNTQTAYCVSSSGSTGIPKLMAISQDNFEAHRAARTNRYRSADRVLLSYPLIFDGALTVIVSCFQAGATLVIPERAELNDGRRLLAIDSLEKTILDLNVTALNMLPSLLSALLKSSNSQVFQKIRHVVLAAEALHTSDWSFIDGCLGKEIQAFNEYGPSETTICATEYEIKRKHQYSETIIPIGKPIQGSQIAIVDEQIKTLSTNEIGEILIIGNIVGSGYLNNSALTAQSFISFKIDGVCQPAYLSGDLGYINSSGDLVWVGRKDSQAKINGVKVRTQEVEALLYQINGTREVATLIISNGNDMNQQLVTFASLDHSKPANIWSGEAKKLLSSRHLYHELKIIGSMPRLVNGKADIAKLRSIIVDSFNHTYSKNSDSTNKSNAYATDERIQSINSIFAEVLGIKEIAPDVSFFAQGGTSLKAMTLAALSRKKIELNLQVTDIFELETPRSIAKKWDTINGRINSNESIKSGLIKKDRWNQNQ